MDSPTSRRHARPRDNVVMEDAASRDSHEGHDDVVQPLLSSSGSAYASQLDSVDSRLARDVLRKIDRRIIPLLFVTYMLNFMDKIILSSAAVFGLPEDTNLHGQQYSWVSSVFYVGYFVWTYPTSVLVARLPTGKYLTANTLFWGAVVALTATCSTFEGLLVARFLLGAAEATITPAFMFLTSTWYTRDEMPTRVGMWFAGNSLGGLVASVFAFGVGHVGGESDEGGVVRPWRWMYGILGTVTFCWAVPLFFLLPDTISKARFLTVEERRVAVLRVRAAGTGSTEKTPWKWGQVRECLVDPKTWLIFCIEVLTQIPNGGAQSFANIVVTSFGFTSLQSTLVIVPVSLLSAACISGTGYLAGRFRTLHCLLIVATILPCVLGSAIIYNRARVPHGVHLVAYFMLSSGPAAMSLAMALVQCNYRGVTKRTTMTALLFVGFCAGNVVGPQFFREEEGPRYETAFRAIMVSYSLAVVCAVGLRGHLGLLNGKRDAEEGVLASAGMGGGLVSASGDALLDDEDLTDWETVGFRYRL